MRVCALNFKGGCGRTTLSLQLAAFYAKQRQRTLLHDRDPQGSALAWAALAEETPFSVGSSRSPGFQVEIIDTAPRMPINGVVPQADLYLIPTLLDAVSFVVFLHTVAFVQERGLPHVIVANRVNERRAEHRARLTAPELAGALVVRERAAYSASYDLGQSVFDLPGRWAGDAQAEIDRIASAIHGLTTMGRAAA